jgi:D-alanyl-D-alanine carboxypeptidase/D-alanyl-D-alanine-endopeptidase (penicillin-binding protein 4)
MKIFQITSYLFAALSLSFIPLEASVNELPEEMHKIMHQKKYDHAIWGIYAKDLHTGKIIFDLNSEKFFSPASTSKLFSVSALLHAYGYDYRFKTPVYVDGQISNGLLQGNLILVAQGDLTMGGRQSSSDKVSYTKMDHIDANEVPGTILTKEDPLKGIKELAKQVAESGIKRITGDVLIDDRLFETTEKRGFTISPIMINENLIDITINPTTVGKKAQLEWRPQIAGYRLDNQVITIDKEGSLEIQATIDQKRRLMVVKGTIPVDQQNVVKVAPITNPKLFAREAFIQALQSQGIKINSNSSAEKFGVNLPRSYEGLKQVALWTSPPLSQYATLILKVSHNIGADLIPLLLAAQKGAKTFDEGMLLFGDYLTHVVGLSPNEFVFVDAAGGHGNRLTLQAEIKLLEHLHKQNPEQFQHFFDALPILGVDGSLEDFGKNTSAVRKVRAKTGTGVAFNFATGKLFLVTLAYAGYIEGKNGNLIAYEVIVNNGTMPTINDVLLFFEDEAQLSNLIYEHSEELQSVETP